MNYLNKKQIVLIFGLMTFWTLPNSKLHAAYLSCWAPDCPSDVQAPPFHGNSDASSIVRTFIHSEKKNVRRTPGSCINPDLPVYIDELDMQDLLEVGSRRITWSTEPGTITNFDVGFPGDDIQVWDFNTLNLFEGYAATSIDPSTSPYIDSFPGSNVVFSSLSGPSDDSLYVHYFLDSLEFLQLGFGADNMGSPYVLDWFETEAFLPIECGWEIDETITTIWAFNPDVDSMVEYKNVVLDATGYMTPINEDPVPAVLALVLYDRFEYQNGSVIDSVFYDYFVWFSEEGHRVIGLLTEDSPTDGMVQFTDIVYEKSVKPCGLHLDIGVDPLEGILRAEFQINSAADINHGPIEFIAGESIDLSPGFSTTKEFEAKIEFDPCN